MGQIRISLDPAEMDVDVIHATLSDAYWARGIPMETVRRSLAGSLVVGAFDGAHQVGFARVVTDRATFAYVSDVFVLDDYRGRGLAHRMMEALLAHPELQGLRRWMLSTRDAHGLYAKLGFTPVEGSARFMEKVDREVSLHPTDTE
jgi:GNAT superfamily N-acetyltransferase